MKTDVKKFLIKTAVTWSVCATVLVIAYALLLFPTQRKVHQEKKRAAEFTRQYKIATELVASKQLEQMRKQVAALRESLDSYTVMTEESRANAFRVSQIAEKSGVKGFTTKYKTRKTLKDIDNCLQIAMSEIDISFKGDYRQFAALINEFERNTPVFFVDSFMVSRTGKTGEPHDINIELRILVDKSGVETEPCEGAAETVQL